MEVPPSIASETWTNHSAIGMPLGSTFNGYIDWKALVCIHVAFPVCAREMDTDCKLPNFSMAESKWPRSCRCNVSNFWYSVFALGNWTVSNTQHQLPKAYVLLQIAIATRGCYFSLGGCLVSGLVGAVLGRCFCTWQKGNYKWVWWLDVWDTKQRACSDGENGRFGEGRTNTQGIQWKMNIARQTAIDNSKMGKNITKCSTWFWPWSVTMPHYAPLSHYRSVNWKVIHSWIWNCLAPLTQAKVASVLEQRQ